MDRMFFYDQPNVSTTRILLRKRLLKLITFIYTVILVFGSSTNAITRHDWKDYDEKPYYFVYRGAHAPYGYNGIIEENYFWTQGYGPAGSVGSPKVYDIKTGELLLEHHGNCGLEFFGNYFVIIQDYADENSSMKNLVYKGSQLILKLDHELLFIDDERWHVKLGDEIVSFSREQNLVINRIKLPKGSVMVHNIEDNKDYILYCTIPISSEILMVDLQRMEHSFVSRNRLKQYTSDNDNNDDINWDYDKNMVINTKNNLYYQIMSKYGRQCWFEKHLLDYDDKNRIVKCINLDTMQEVWKKECYIGDACVYKGKMFCYFDEKTKPRQACIDIKTGKIHWSESSFMPRYYWTVFVGETAYDNANGRFVKLDLKTGKDMMSVPRNRVTAIDFKRDRYYTYEPDWTPHCYELSTHKKVW